MNMQLRTATSSVKEPRVKYVHEYLSGRVITSRKVSDTDPYSGEWIVDAIACSFDVRSDAVECVETDEGEFYTIDGERVAYVEVN